MSCIHFHEFAIIGAANASGFLACYGNVLFIEKEKLFGLLYRPVILDLRRARLSSIRFW